MKYWDSEILNFWTSELLNFWTSELLRFWDSEILRFWDSEILRCWVSRSLQEPPGIARSLQVPSGISRSLQSLYVFVLFLLKRLSRFWVFYWCKTAISGKTSFLIRSKRAPETSNFPPIKIKMSIFKTPKYVRCRIFHLFRNYQNDHICIVKWHKSVFSLFSHCHPKVIFGCFKN